MNDFYRHTSAVIAVAFVTGLLSACAASPMHFYTLVTPAVALSPQPPNAPSFAFALDGVSVPHQADIPQLIVSSKIGSLTLAEDRRWIAPLGEEIGAAMSQHLQSRLGVSDVSRVPAPAGTQVYRVKIDVQRFESVPGAQTLVAALWSIRAAEATTATASASASCMSRASEPASANYDALVEGYRRAVASIAEQIAAGIDALAQNRAPISCPAAAGS